MCVFCVEEQKDDDVEEETICCLQGILLPRTCSTALEKKPVCVTGGLLFAAWDAVCCVGCCLLRGVFAAWDVVCCVGCCLLRGMFAAWDVVCCVGCCLLRGMLFAAWDAVCCPTNTQRVSQLPIS